MVQTITVAAAVSQGRVLTNERLSTQVVVGAERTAAEKPNVRASFPLVSVTSLQ